MSVEPKYNINVQLTGKDGNAINLIGIVTKALRNYGIPREQISEFQDEAMNGNYDHLLQTCMKWVNCE